MKLSCALVFLLTSASVAAESEPLQSITLTLEDPCAGAICDAATPNCVVDDTAKLGFNCIADEVVIPADFAGGCASVLCTPEEPVCQDVGGVVSCINPCATVRCASDTPVCIIQSDNSPSCEISPCATVRCPSGTTCEWDVFGQAMCAPDAVPTVSCLTVKCSKEKPYCDDSSGLPVCSNPCDDKTCAKDEVCQLQNVVCVKAPCPPLATCVSIRPWWQALQDTYDGEERLRKCIQRETPPADGERCGSNPKACFFGTKDCAAGFKYPETKCVCKDRKWSCEFPLTCPASFP